MTTVSIRDLRNHGGEVVDRVAAGEHVTITRGGRPVAELRPVSRPGPSARALAKRWSRLPGLDPRKLREDVDSALDAGL